MASMPNFDTDDMPALTVRRVQAVSGTQVMFAIIVAIALMLAINFSGRVSADRQLAEVYDKVIQEIDLLKREQADLIARLADAQSAAFVERWARSEGKMVRDGEVLVLPVPVAQTQSETPNGFVVPEATGLDIQTQAPPQENWQVWWALFFDSPPPQLSETP